MKLKQFSENIFRRVSLPGRGGEVLRGDVPIMAPAGEGKGIKIP